MGQLLVQLRLVYSKGAYTDSGSALIVAGELVTISKRSWLAAFSIGLLPWLGSAVSKHYEMVLNQTGSQSALRMIPVGWLIAIFGGFFLAYFLLDAGLPKLPPLILTLVSLLGSLPTWSRVVPSFRGFDWLSDMPASWQQFGGLEPIAVNMVLGFALGWLWKATR